MDTIANEASCEQPSNVNAQEDDLSAKRELLSKLHNLQEGGYHLHIPCWSLKDSIMGMRYEVECAMYHTNLREKRREEQEKRREEQRTRAMRIRLFDIGVQQLASMVIANKKHTEGNRDKPSDGQ